VGVTGLLSRNRCRGRASELNVVESLASVPQTLGLDDPGMLMGLCRIGCGGVYRVILRTVVCGRWSCAFDSNTIVSAVRLPRGSRYRSLRGSSKFIVFLLSDRAAPGVGAVTLASMLRLGTRATLSVVYREEEKNAASEYCQQDHKSVFSPECSPSNNTQPSWPAKDNCCNGSAIVPVAYWRSPIFFELAE